MGSALGRREPRFARATGGPATTATTISSSSPEEVGGDGGKSGGGGSGGAPNFPFAFGRVGGRPLLSAFLGGSLRLARREAAGTATC